MSSTSRRRARLRVFVTGIPAFGDLMVRLSGTNSGLEVRYARNRSRFEVMQSLFALARSDVWYSVGSVASSRWLIGCARLFHKQRVMHWIGSDILRAEKEPSVLRQFDTTVRHLASAPWNRDELAALGIEAKVAPIPPLHRVGDVTPLPAQFTALAYIPTVRPGFYGIEVCEELGRIFGERVAWIVVGGARPAFPPAVRVEYIPWSASMAEIYARSTVLVRCTEHDGLSLSVIEALTAGRYVLWSYPFPSCRPARDVVQARTSLEALLALHERGQLPINEEGARFVRERFTQDKLFEAIRTAWAGTAS